MKNNVKLIAAFVVFLVAIVATIGFSYAYFTGKDEVKNPLTMGNPDIDLQEPNWNEETANSVTPGKVILKDPTLIGVDGNNYARIVVEFYDTDSNKIITDESRIEQIQRLLYYDTDYNSNATIKTPNLAPTSTYSLKNISDLIDTGKIENIYNSTDFTYDTERSTSSKFVFNYNNILAEDDEKVLFTNIVIPTDFTDFELNEIGNFTINIYAEAIQSEFIDSQAAAYTALDDE